MAELFGHGFRAHHRAVQGIISASPRQDHARRVDHGQLRAGLTLRAARILAHAEVVPAAVVFLLDEVAHLVLIPDPVD